MRNETAESDTVKKPSYDGRLHYQKTLNDLMQQLHFSAINNDYDMWLKVARCVMNWINGFIKGTHLHDLKERINNGKHLLSLYKNKRISSIKLENELNDLNEKLMNYSKYLLLPLADDDDDTFLDMEEFDRQFEKESGL